MIRPLPRPTPVTVGFWEAARRGALVVQRCTACTVLRHYPRPMCPACRSFGVEWVPVRGTGTVHTFTVTHRAFHPAWEVPYAVVTVTLDEGPRLVADLPAENTDAVRIGSPVEVFFDEVTGPDGVFVLPRFRLSPLG
jgi:uncharacterized protein